MSKNWSCGSKNSLGHIRKPERNYTIQCLTIWIISRGSDSNRSLNAWKDTKGITLNCQRCLLKQWIVWWWVWDQMGRKKLGFQRCTSWRLRLYPLRTLLKMLMIVECICYFKYQLNSAVNYLGITCNRQISALYFNFL